MFERTTSLWRRLIKRDTDADSATANLEERRVWLRHPCDLQTQYGEPDRDESPLAARILDISRGGVKVVVNRSHPLGSLISIELPGPSGETTFAALACVVHEGELDTDEWVLGCNFSKELEEDQLRAFGVGEPGPATADKRSWPRFTGNVTASVQLTNSTDPTRRPAKVLNLSAGGVALSVNHEIHNGTLLTVDLSGANGHTVSTILACVVHLTLKGDGTRRLGCNFIRELPADDLKALL
jgi:c-di-GMP-binding flagellar brake protein YcgR